MDPNLDPATIPGADETGSVPDEEKLDADTGEDEEEEEEEEEEKEDSD